MVRDGDESLLSAVVVASARTPKGPRQRHLCYLGSVRESDWGAVRGHYACRFWADVLANLTAAGIAGADRERIEGGLEVAVPRPTDEDWVAELEWTRRHLAQARSFGKNTRDWVRRLNELFPDAGLVVPADRPAFRRGDAL
jgi:hypothetical protein